MKRKQPSEHTSSENSITIVNVWKTKTKTQYLLQEGEEFYWESDVSDSAVKQFENVRLSGKGSLQAKYVVPPLDILKLNSKVCTDRRDEWKHLFGFNDTYLRQNIGRQYGSNLNRPTNAVSEYNPVMAELIFSWYCGLGKSILDPFAGGPYKGLIAAILGCSYTGIEIREEQVAYNLSCANKLQVSQAVWIHGDASKLSELLPVNKKYELLFSCPPYGNLEKYSTLSGDLSNMPVAKFWETFCKIMTVAVDYLQDNAFVVLQVANFTVEQGEVYPFDSNIVQLLVDLGLKLYSQSTIERKYGEAAARCANQFPQSRKLTKISEKLLVFAKGDVKNLLQLPEYNVLTTPTKRKDVQTLYKAYAEHSQQLSEIQPLVNNVSETENTLFDTKQEYMSQNIWSELSRNQRKRIHKRHKDKLKKQMLQAKIVMEDL